MLDEQALDSFSNLVFSLVTFWKAVRKWPQKISIVSHEFKRERFLECHVKALGLSRERVEFWGIDPVYMRSEAADEYDEQRARGVRDGERRRGFEAWKRDLWGVGPSVRGKRRQRNCWDVRQELFECKEDRLRSGLKSKVVEYEDMNGKMIKKEVVSEEKQPWED